MEHHLVLRVIAKFIIPMILLFAFYVQFHGDYGPGGGFQAGVIFAAGFILHALIFGLDHTRKVLPPVVLRVTGALGLLLYLGTGLAGILLGGNYLDYNVFAADPISGQHLGILLIEMGVGITVASVMLSLFYIFAQP
ncbi:MAG: Na(+)/H(+) antiporter subunit B [Gammaproteobacteria bacterium]|nr:Na(+)/H(+) antiporter subunit B [Gammaproteobacteria bacterium]NIN60865.1 Na(+)/H(+) antiporter subunit B [Gammaproteobacteria bacterium]NIO62488.1 Na(+)/H(+) antiporter subunit B [Gammaproteobacteria bacterium]NIP49594.1 Na(+)/H(+) antiporter subunit B [Gammaproteobacteria bacterium]NIQ10819.1 Na(+)/H(+) antiporter subunit B [Gammaproteobacteria bacterium]